jgi:ubiquitin carboxyl-terminal hydrolase 9/24
MDFILLSFRCFERFFKAVNSKEGKLKAKRRAFLMDDVDLIGTEYLWRVSKNFVSVLFL